MRRWLCSIVLSLLAPTALAAPIPMAGPGDPDQLWRDDLYAILQAHNTVTDFEIAGGSLPGIDLPAGIYGAAPYTADERFEIERAWVMEGQSQFVVHAVNEMLNLDPLSKADRETQRQLDELLAKLTGDKPQQRPLHGLSNLQLRTEHDRVLEHWWHQAREFDGAF